MSFVLFDVIDEFKHFLCDQSFLFLYKIEFCLEVFLFIFLCLFNFILLRVDNFLNSLNHFCKSIFYNYF